MAKDTITRSPLVAVFLAVNMVFQSPAGHDLIYQGLLRGWFATTWLQASIDAGRPISFQTLRDHAAILAYDDNPETFMNNMRLLAGDFSFCLPLINEGDEDAPNAPQNHFACHAASTRNDKKDKKSLDLI